MPPAYPARLLPAAERARYRAHGMTSDETMPVLLERAAARLGDHDALIDLCNPEPRHYRYREANDIVDKFATFLRANGVTHGDLVLIQAPNSAEVVFAAWAAWRIGAVVNPVVDIYRTHELRHIVGLARPDVVVTVREHRDFRQADAFDELLAEHGHTVKARVLLGEGQVDGWTPFGGAIDNDGDAAHPAMPHPDDPALLLFTSGTTSLPKGAVHSHRTLIAEAIQMANGWSMGWNDRMYLALPIAHITGVLFALTVPLYRGGTAVLARMVSLQQSISQIVEHRVTVTTLAPNGIPQLRDAYQSAGLGSIPLRILASGGTNVPKVLIEAAESLGIRPCRIYGMTEMPTVTMPCPTDTDRQRLDTDGMIAPDCECEAVDPDSRLPVEPGTEGELRVRGPERMLGYLDDAQTDAQIDDDGWFYTGDLGIVDAEGCVSITGRIKDIINRGGEKFSARDIEDVIVAHSGVDEIAVVAAPDRRFGEVPAAFVVAAAGATPTEADLIETLRAASVARQKIPAHWYFVDELPTNASGKVKKFELVARVVAAQELDS